MAPFRLMRAAFPHLKAAGQGRIVSIRPDANGSYDASSALADGRVTIIDLKSLGLAGVTQDEMLAQFLGLYVQH